MNRFPHHTALVLGGGGSAGNAWLIGVVAGLHQAGLDVTDADLIVGTSAGSTAAAQITASDPTALYPAILTTPTTPPAGSRGPGRGPIPPGRLERTSEIIADSSDAADMRRRVGATAIELADAAGDAALAARRSTVASRLPHAEWPQQRMLLTAVAARTGEPVTFDRDSGVALTDAVAASSAGGFAHAIEGTWYFDGGYRTNADNADLASGCERVLVLSPFGGRSRLPREWGTHLDTQLEQLRREGSRVETIFPDDASRAAFGDDMMNLSARAPAARAGFTQGTLRAAELASFWR